MNNTATRLKQWEDGALAHGDMALHFLELQLQENHTWLERWALYVAHRLCYYALYNPYSRWQYGKRIGL